MQAHRVEATVRADGRVVVDRVPFRPGERVEVILLPTSRDASLMAELRGSIQKYERPLDPVGDDWDAARP